jgi:hypothetical protein
VVRVQVMSNRVQVEFHIHEHMKTHRVDPFIPVSGNPSGIAYVPLDRRVWIVGYSGVVCVDLRRIVCQMIPHRVDSDHLRENMLRPCAHGLPPLTVAPRGTLYER